MLSLQPFLSRRSLLQSVDQMKSVRDGTELGPRLLQTPYLLKLLVGRIFSSKELTVQYHALGHTNI